MSGFKDSKVGGIDGAGTVGGAIWTVQDEAIKQNWPGTTTFNVFGKLGASTFVAFEAMEVASGFAQDGVKGGAVQAAGAAWGWEAASRAIPSGVSLGANLGKVGGAAGQAVGGAIVGTVYGVVAGFGMETAVEALAPDAIDSNAYALLASTMAAKEILDVYAAHMSYTAKNIETYNPFTDYIYGTLATTIALSRAIKVFEDAYFPAPAPSSPFSDADAIENLREFVDNLDKSAETIKGVVSTGLGYQPGSQSSAQHSNNQVPSVPNLYDPLGSIYDLPKNPSFDNHTSYGGDGGSSYGDSDAGGGTASSGSDQNTSTAQENSSSSGASDYFGGGYTGEGYNGVGSGGYSNNSGNNSSGRNNEKSGRPEPNYGGSDGGDDHGRSDDHSSSYGDSDAGGGSSTSGSHSSPDDVGSVDRGTCFVAGTLILMADGSAKPIEQVGLEDQVMAFDGLGALEPCEVTDLFVHGKKQVLDVDGVQVTSEHPFLLADGSFRPVAELRVGDQIVRADGSLHTIERIAEVEGRHTVYNFTVAELHTYVAAGFRVHNKFVDPVILDLDGNGIQVTRLDQSTIFMDAGGDGLEHRTAWAASGDGVLFYDPDGRDAITEKRQFVFTEWDPTATSDMEALASVFDSNGDGVLSAEDAAFAKFKLLVTNADGSTSVKTLTELGITQINLTADATNIELSDGSVIAGQTTFTWSDGTTGTVGDMKLAASDMGYRVEQVESIDGAGARTLIATAYESDGSKAYEIHSVTDADGLVLTNRYDDNGDGVTNRIQSIVTVVGSDGSRTQTESNFAGSDIASAVLRSRIQTTTSADGNTLTIERDMTGGGWFDQREVRATQSDGSQVITISALAKDGSVITSRSETVSSDGTVRVDGHDQDGDGSADTNETHSVTVNGDDSRSETIAITNQDGSLRSHVKEDVSADGRTKVVERDLDGDGDTDTREELSITVAADGQTTSELTVKNGDGSLRSSTTTVQSADALTRTTTADQDGDGDIDLTIVDTTTIAADGSREQVVTQTNADGSVRSMTRETLGADKVSQQTFVDLNQNGSLEANEVVSSVVSSSTTQDRIATSWTRNADGSVNAKTVATTSADGLRTTTHTDRDGDGDTDVSVQDITSTDGGGNSTRTVTTRNSDGSLRSQAKVSTSADGLSVTTTTDVDGDGQIDARTVEVLAKESDGGTRQTRSDYAGDGSLISKQVVDESADRRVKTTRTDLDGDGNNDAVSIRTEQTDGSVSLQETSYANDGTALGQTLTTSSANGLTTSVARDLDGDLSADVTVTSVTTLNADGSKTTVQETRNADGSLRSQSTLSVSDDRLQSVTQTDDDGDGTFERSVQDTTVLKADGSTVRTSETRSDNGSLLSRTQATLSDDELSSVVKTDADGDGTYDLIKTTVAELQADGSLVTTVELRDGSGALRTRSVETVSDNERYRSSEVDVNGDGQADQITTQTIAEDGVAKSVTQQLAADGSVQSQNRTETSANGLKSITQTDRDGDGVYESASQTDRSLNADGSQTSITTHKGQDGTFWSRSFVTQSDDGLSSMRLDDRDGDGQNDRSQTSTTILAADGGQSTLTNVTSFDGSLLSRTLDSVSGDGRLRMHQVDVDGNGHHDEVSTTTLRDDGGTVTTTSTYSDNGTLLSKMAKTQNGNGLETSFNLDLDGDGATDRTLDDVTAYAADGTQTRTVTHQNSQGGLLARESSQISGDGLTQTSLIDRNGDGAYERQTTQVTTFSNDGTVATASTTKDASGTTTSSSTETTSGDGLEVTQSTDFDGDGSTNRTAHLVRGASGGSTSSVSLLADNADVLRTTKTVISADERTKTTSVDLDGDGDIDQKIVTHIDLSKTETTTYTELAEDGSTASSVTRTMSANGTEQSYAFDLDGDGTAEITRTTTISFDASGNQIRVFEEKYAEDLRHSSTTITSANGLTSTTSIDSDGDGEIDVTVTDETVLHSDGSSTFTSADRYEDGTLRSSYKQTTSSDGRTISKTYDFDGDGRKDKTEVTKTLADGSQTLTETGYAKNGSVFKTAVTSTSSDGLTSTIVRDGVTQTISRSVLNDGSYTWDNGVAASASDTNIKVSHTIDSHGMETWQISETISGSTTTTVHRLDEQAKARMLYEAAQVYDSVLDREMNTSEIEVLIRYLEDGQLDAIALAEALLTSDEYQTRYGTLSNAGFVARAFQNTLGRTPELAELSEYLDEMTFGTLTRAQLLADLALSVEHQVTGNGHSATENPDVFLLPVRQEKDLTASFGVEGLNISTNDMRVLIGDDTDDTIHVSTQEATFGGKGDDTITGSDKNDILLGGEGNDTLKAENGNDTLAGGKGDDLLEGGKGADAYLFSRGDGKDTIKDASGEPSTSGTVFGVSVFSGFTSRGSSSGRTLFTPSQAEIATDVIRLSDDIELEDITLKRSGDDLLIYILPSDNQDQPLSEVENVIRIKDWDKASYRIESLQFASGVSVPLSRFSSSFRKAAEGATVSASSGHDWIEGAAGNETLKGKDGSDFLIGREGNDTLEGGDGYDSLFGGEGNDTLRGGGHNDLLVGGVGDDNLQGGTGDDTYIYSHGDGKDTIYDYGGTNDLLILTDLKLDEITLRTEGKDLVIYVLDPDNPDAALADLSDSIRIKNWNTKTTYTVGNLFGGGGSSSAQASPFGLPEYANRIDTLRFADGYELELGEIKKIIENQTIKGGSGKDLLIARDGNDVIEGGASDDTYVFMRGFGHDTILDTSGSMDKIQFADGITLADLKMRNENGDLQIYLMDAENRDQPLNEIADVLTIKNWTNTTSPIKRFEFADGSVVSKIEICDDGRLKLYGETGAYVVGSDEDDFIYGTTGADVLSAGRGADDWQHLYGYSGDDTYLYGFGGGNAMISASEGANDGTDIVRFTDLNLSDFTIDTQQYSDSNGLVLKFQWNKNGEQGQLRIANMGQHIERFEFADGTILSSIELLESGQLKLRGFADQDNVILGSAYDDFVNGSDGNDTLSAGLGAGGWQHIAGFSGNDTYLYGKGHGAVLINAHEGEGDGTDTVRFTDLSLSDLRIGTHEYSSTSAQGTALKFGWSDGGDSGQLRIANMGQHIERFEFADGTVVSKIVARDDGRVELHGTDGDDIIKGGSASNLIYAGDGNDTLDAGGHTEHWQHLRGQEGDDTYLIGADDGVVAITQSGEWSGSGTDTVRFKDLSLKDLQLSSYTHENYGEILKLTWNKDGQIGSLHLSDMGQHIEHFEFADGTVLDKIEIRDDGRLKLFGADAASGAYVIGSDEDDFIYGTTGADVLSAGRGADDWQHLFGYSGDDTYLYGFGGGNTMISASEGANDGTDIVRFTDLNLSDFTIGTQQYSDSNGLVLKFQWNKNGEQGQLRVAQMGEYIERFEFADGTVVGKIVARDDGRLELYGTDGDDIIKGGSASSLIYAGKGNDTLEAGSYGGWWQHLKGQEGDDTYIYKQENQVVALTSSAEKSGWGDDRIVFKDLSLSDVSVQIQDNESYGQMLQFAWSQGDLNGSLLVADLGEHIERFEFADGSVFSKIAVRDDGRVELYGVGQVYGSAASDVIYGSHHLHENPEGLLGNDELHGRAGNDKIIGDYAAITDPYRRSITANHRAITESKDKLYGGEGDDILDGGLYDDELYGGVGNDILIGGSGDDVLNGGSGVDTADYRGHSDGIQVNLAETTYSGSADGDTLTSVENIRGTYLDDVIIGDNQDNVITGFGGNDTLTGGAGNDTLIGSATIDGAQLAGGPGVNGPIAYHGGNDTLTGGIGSDVFVFGGTRFGNDTITDFVVGAGSSDTIWFDSEVFADFDAVVAAASDEGSSVVIKLDDYNSVTLNNVSKSELHADDFQFV
ncbi:Bifunctional hemolysin/adenylate cyclase precursor [Pseudovibrio sp. Ad5]|uniref:DUF4214 domain-containing protein n=1 Tax=Pseudovibrio sp. Ad5 TaxID=989436 RepID=UPI0007AE7E46|nr:DUF4214 domain-containing protein [Pseudovibrio sp. Ad5]KZK97222.1 Bifunctional hemolysin/adenylate cyclase precursor [Pseudovibrio sp. Ad5]